MEKTILAAALMSLIAATTPQKSEAGIVLILGSGGAALPIVGGAIVGALGAAGVVGGISAMGGDGFGAPLIG